MGNNRASERYAKSLLMLSIDERITDEIKGDIDLIIDSFSKSREISSLYLSPIIPIKHKISITKKIFTGKIHNHTLNLLLNFAAAGLERLKLLDKVSNYFDESQMIESLSDSTLYMAFYTIAHLLPGANSLTPAAPDVASTHQARNVTDAEWDFIFLGAPLPSAASSGARSGIFSDRSSCWCA